VPSVSAVAENEQINPPIQLLSILIVDNGLRFFVGSSPPASHCHLTHAIIGERIVFSHVIDEKS